jgi:hypothetical protein
VLEPRRISHPDDAPLAAELPSPDFGCRDTRQASPSVLLGHFSADEMCVHAPQVAFVINEPLHQIKSGGLKGWSKLLVLAASEF